MRRGEVVTRTRPACGSALTSPDPVKTETVRHHILALLEEGPLTAKEISSAVRRPEKEMRESPGAPSGKHPFRRSPAVAGSGRMSGMRIRVPEAEPPQGAKPMSRLQGRSDSRPIVPGGRQVLT